MNKTIAFMLLLPLTACTPETAAEAEHRQMIEQAEKARKLEDVTIVRKVAGCTVYRFYDDWSGRPVYFSDCRGRTEYEYSERSGKLSSIKQMQTVSE